MANSKKQDPLKVDTKVATGNKGATTREGSITTPDIREHLERLQGVSSVASKILSLLGEQIASVSATIPIQRGNETLDDLKSRARTHRDGLKTAFDPLRDQIETLKAGFWAKNRERLKAITTNYIQQKIKDRVIVEVSKQIKRYTAYLENNETDSVELEEASEACHARVQNSLLRVKYPEEPVAWIGDLPNGSGPTVTFGKLIGAEGEVMIQFAKSLGLSPAQQDDRIDVLNKIMHRLGIMYKGLQSRAGMLLMPTTTNL